MATNHFAAMDYTATGPSTGPSAGFKTQGEREFPHRPTCDFGADVEGKQSGVRAKGAESGVHGISDATGIHGEGDATGVRGESDAIGVLGVVNSTDDARGVIGVGKRGATGILGICAARKSIQTDARNGVEGVSDGSSGAGVLGRSIDQVEDDNETELPPLDDRSGRGAGVKGLTGTGVGVVGVSERNVGVSGIGPVGVIGTASRGPKKKDLFRVGGIGVQGESEEGEGVHGESKNGTGIKGYSNAGRGGVFECADAAQLQLVPHPIDLTKRGTNRPPTTGRAGDLFAMTVPSPFVVDSGRGQVAELWFCIRGSSKSRDAIWGHVLFDKFV